MLAVISPIPAVRPDFPPFTSDGDAVPSELMVSGTATKIVTQFLPRVSEFSAVP
jgi:hypothetical protein